MRTLITILLALALTLSGCAKKTNESVSSNQTHDTTTTKDPSQQQSGNQNQNQPSDGNQQNNVNPSAPSVDNVNATKPALPKPPAGAKEPSLITKKQYDSLKFYMTYDEVRKAIGLGKLVNQTEHQADYEYKGKNGAKAKLTFWDGKLMSKGNNDLTS